MATGGQRSTPSFFNFLKEGLLLPAKNPRLFAAVFAIIVASTSLLHLGHSLAVKPLLDEISIDTKALNSTDPRSPDFMHLIQEIRVDARDLMITIAVYLLVSLIIGWVIRIIVLFAAVATCSGELQHTFASLLGKAKAQLKGPILTLAFVCALEIAYLALVAAMAGLLFFLMIKRYLALLFVCALLVIVASIFAVYFSFVCSLSIVVAVAEPGCHGAGAVGRAWRLMKGKGKLLQAVFFIFVTVVLAAAFWPVYTLAKTCAVTNMALGLLLGLLYTALMAAVQVFASCAMTAFYYEGKGSTVALATEYIQVSTEEPINV